MSSHTRSTCLLIPLSAFGHERRSAGCEITVKQNRANLRVVPNSFRRIKNPTKNHLAAGTHTLSGARSSALSTSVWILTRWKPAFFLGVVRKTR